MRSLRFLAAILLALLPGIACADQITISTGVTTSISQVLEGVVNVVLAVSGVIATGLFLVGAMIMVGSTGNDQFVTAGKRLMKASVIGLVIVLSSWMILSTLVFFIYG
jgi:hypothetical protein